MNEEIIYFELNDWFPVDFYPNCEPFLTWMENETDGSPLRDENWLKENKICVKSFAVDMSISFLITAPKSFVEKVCPALLEEENRKFLRYPDEGKDVPESNMEDESFLPYTEENIGKIVYTEWY